MVGIARDAKPGARAHQTKPPQRSAAIFGRKIKDYGSVPASQPAGNVFVKRDIASISTAHWIGLVR
jgi:hypothetical protein